jgi:CBS domain containing-hemolysin-like protein
MDDDSPDDREQGRSFWGGLRAFLLGDDQESSLRDEIEDALENREGEAPRAGDLSAAERLMLKNILHFGEKNAGDVAVPRSDVIAVPSTIGFDALVEALKEAEHSRLPVYEGSLDHVVGMFHIKDVFAHVVSGRPAPDDVKELMRAPLYVPESMGMLDLLARMRAQRTHLAIVVDEFGGTEGLLTIEDVVEEIVGDIEDEHDEEPVGMLAEVAPGIWEADARAELEDVAEVIDERLGLVEEDVDTLGGLAFILAGRIPQPGDTIEHPTGWRLEVTEGDTRRVTRLRLHAPEEARAED